MIAFENLACSFNQVPVDASEPFSRERRTKVQFISQIWVKWTLVEINLTYNVFPIYALVFSKFMEIA